MDALFSFCHSNKKTIPENLPFPTKKKNWSQKIWYPQHPQQKMVKKVLVKFSVFIFQK